MAEAHGVAARANALRAEIQTRQRELERAKSELAGIEARCSHAWSDPIQTTERYRAEGVGEPIAQGSDLWYAPRFYDATRPIWTRTCRRCARTEVTHETRAVTHQVPRFGT